MPVFLPQLSRREFLKRAALAGVAVAAAPSLYAQLAGKPRDPDLFFFLSDTHIAADITFKHREVNMAENFAAVARELAAWPAAPAAIVVSGDLAFKLGEAGDYAAFGKLLEPVRVLAPVHLLLGNHDRREHFWDAFPRDAARVAAVPQKQAAKFSSERADWFLLDSLNVTDVVAGRLGAAQLEWLDRELAAHPEKPAVVVCHHNLNTHGGILGLEDSVPMMELLDRRRQVKAFVFGHTHDWHVARHGGVQLVNLPPTAYVFERGRPSGWVRATLKPDGMEIELRALDGKHPDHAQVKRLAWRT